MSWTFDPLIARNARLNLGKLGAVATAYHPDWYALSDDREAAFPADRLMVEWDLTQGHTERSAPPPRGQMALSMQGGGGPGVPRLELTDDLILAEVPLQLEGLDDGRRLAWRLALRAVLSSYLARGYAATELARESGRAFYVLSGG